jgi:ABC-type molybdate transport system ATPase subunit
LLKLNIKQQLSNFTLDISIEVPPHKITAIYGPSGSGKSSLLRIISGLELLSGNEVSFQKQVWQDKNIFIPPEKRRIGMAFQEAYLFPHLNVKDNLLFVSTSPPPDMFDKLVNDFSLQHLLSRMPHKLSGGEQQKIALARTLLHSPQLLLLDEAFAALDNTGSMLLLDYLKQQTNLPIIMVNHNINEIMHCADYVIKLATGKITHHGNIYRMLEHFEDYSKYNILLDVTKTDKENLLFSSLGLIILPSWQQQQQTSRILIQSNNISINNRAITPLSISAQITQINVHKSYYELECHLSNNSKITIPIAPFNCEFCNYTLGEQLFLTINSFKFI